MIPALLLLVLGLSLLLILVTYVQLLYLESLRLRAREAPALTFFKQRLEERLGLKGDAGALAFSLIKHLLLPLLGILVFAIAAWGQAASAVTFLQACLFAFLLVLLCTYVVPQFLYRRTEGHWVLPTVPVLRLCALLVRPVTAILTFLQSLVELGNEAPGEADTTSSAEDIEALISAGTEEGIIEEGDRKLIESVVAFGDKTVREVMTARPNIVAISHEASLEDLRQLVIHEQYSRIPVFGGDIDNIIGFVHVRDVFELEPDEREGRQVRELMRIIRAVPETKPVNDMLREMQADGAHMVVVIDEYGNTAGLATMEDLVEEVFGEIRDEHEPALDIENEPDGSCIVSGSYDLDHLHDLFEFRADDETESTTVGGLVTEWSGHVPVPGEIIERDGLRIEVLASNERRVEQVRIGKAPVPAPEETDVEQS